MRRLAMWASLLLMAVALAVGIRGTRLHAGEEPEAPGKKQMVMLTDPDRSRRETACEALLAWRKELSQTVVASITGLVTRPDLAYHGRLDVSIEVAGAYRLVEAVPTLVGAVQLRLDKDTFPAGDRIKTERLYPAALALVKIGDGSMVNALLGRIATDDDDTVARTAAWVLREYLGKSGAANALADEIGRRAKQDEQRRLRTAVALVAEEVILLYK